MLLLRPLLNHSSLFVGLTLLLICGCSPAEPDNVGPGGDSPSVWGPVSKLKCTAPGSGQRRYEAILHGHGESPCDGPPHNIMGAHFPSPTSCDASRGIWHVADSTCAAVMPELPGRGSDELSAQQNLPAEGYADLHNHLLAHIAFGESVLWGDAFGEPEAVLQPIPEELRGPHQRIEGLTSSRSVFGLWKGHDELGHPDYTGWPTPGLRTHQQSHVDWLYRAYQGGLRLLVVPAVNNQDMFGRGEDRIAKWLEPVMSLVGSGAQPRPHRTSNDMEAVEHQVRAAHELEQWVAEHRGGWLAIAETPEEASALLADGRLAIVLGSEVDHQFNCDLGRRCDERHIQESLTRMEALGLAVFFPSHHKETQFGDSANFQPLNSGPLRDCPQFTKDCAALGLTAKGELLIREMMQRGLIADLGHAGDLPFAETVALLGSENYPFIMTHAGAHPLKPKGGPEYTLTFEQLLKLTELGGMVSVHSTEGEYAGVNNQGARSPLATNAGGGGYTQSYLYTLDATAGGYFDANALELGGRIGFAADWNGFASWPFGRFGPNPPERRLLQASGEALTQPPALAYPLRLPPNLVAAAVGGVSSLDTMQFEGRRYDFNVDGLAQAGLSPDLLEDMRMHGLSAAELDPLYRSARGFVTMWQRARDLNTAGDRGWLRWLPQSPTDLIEFEYLDESRIVEVSPGVAVCRARGSRKVGSLQEGRCVAVVPQAESTASIYPVAGELRNANSGYCLSVSDTVPGRGSVVSQRQCDGSEIQRWEIDTPSGGAVRLAGSDLCLVSSADKSLLAACDTAGRFDWQRIGNTFRLQTKINSQISCMQVVQRSLEEDAPVAMAACPPAGRADFHWEYDALRDASDSERLFSTRALATSVAWRAAPDSTFAHAVTAENGAALCRANGVLGVVSAARCKIADEPPAETYQQLVTSSALIH